MRKRHRSPGYSNPISCRYNGGLVPGLANPEVLVCVLAQGGPSHALVQSEAQVYAPAPGGPLRVRAQPEDLVYVPARRGPSRVLASPGVPVRGQARHKISAEIIRIWHLLYAKIRSDLAEAA